MLSQGRALPSVFFSLISKSGQIMNIASPDPLQLPKEPDREDLVHWIAVFPGLMWVIELPRSRISLLNNWQHPLLGDETSRLIKDSFFRKEWIVREDLALVAEFWDVMANRQPAAVTFRLKKAPDDPFLLQGWPHPDNPTAYMGLLKQAFIPQPFALGVNLGSCQMALTRSSYPVLLLDSSTEQIITCNKAAMSLFAIDRDSRRGLSDIAPGALRALACEAIARAIEEDVWGGILTLRGASGTSFSAKVRISPAMEKLRQVVRIAFLEGPSPDAALAATPEPLNEAGKRALQNVREAGSFRGALEALLRSFADNAVEALMFSDIKALLGRVEVYAVGKPFATREWGGRYAYDGTIAQDIERFDLCSLIVDDTLDSIKSIDWVLFNPRGIRSYFAKPFFAQGRLESVLILASTRVRQFSAEAEQTYSVMFPAFEEAVRLWRLGVLP